MTQHLKCSIPTGFIVIQPAKPKTREGKIELPQQSVSKTWHGRVVLEHGGPPENPTVVWYSRSFPLEPIQLPDLDGNWHRDDFFTLPVQAVRATWTGPEAAIQALMNPDAEPVDHTMERELAKVREAQS